MRFRRACLEELGRFGWISLCAVVAGLTLGQLEWACALIVPVYTLRSGYELLKTLQWLDSASSTKPTNASGFSALLESAVLTERKTAAARQSTLVRQIQSFETGLHALPDAIVAVDGERHIVWSNSSAAPLLGIKAGTDTGQPIDNLVRHPEFIRLLKKESAPSRLAIPSPTDPDRIVTIRAVPNGEKQSVILARDDTESVRLERMRQDFISNVSHELKTPLTVLAGYLETMEEAGQDLPPRWHRPTQAMSEQVVRMSRLVEDLLLLARLESVDRSPEEEAVNVPALLQGLLEEARVLSGAMNHQLDLDATPGLYLLGNANELRAAFSNLIANAVQYTPIGGRIAIRWHCGENGVHFNVEDTGEGIDGQHLGRLTERFYRIDPGRARSNGGTGLGLAIVKHALQHCDATLQIESEIGVGSTFSCHFPPERAVRANDHRGPN